MPKRLLRFIKSLDVYNKAKFLNANIPDITTVFCFGCISI